MFILLLPLLAAARPNAIGPLLHTRASSASSAAPNVDPLSPPRRTASSISPSSDRMTQSLYIPTSSTPHKADLSQSVIVGPAQSQILDASKARSLVDERRRVDARAAASKLANML